MVKIVCVYLLNISLDISARHLTEMEKAVFDKSRLFVTYDSVSCCCVMTQKSVHPFTLPVGLLGDYFEMHRLKYNLLVFFFLWLFRRDKLWICMEYCGGGSLQDIYHGKIHHIKVNNQLQH